MIRVGNVYIVECPKSKQNAPFSSRFCYAKPSKEIIVFPAIDSNTPRLARHES